MHRLSSERETSIRLRRQGLTYTEILRTVQVTRSTLSLWLRDVKLSTQQKSRINEISRKSLQSANEARKNSFDQSRIELTKKASDEIKDLSLRELWLIGIALYWAEGSKQNKWNVSTGVRFSNSDPDMILIYIMWLRNVLKIQCADIQYEIYLHKSSIVRTLSVKKFWSSKLSEPIEKFDRIYVKKNLLKKRNSNREYMGLLRVVVRKSSSLNRKITGWQKGIVNSCRVV